MSTSTAVLIGAGVLAIGGLAIVLLHQPSAKPAPPPPPPPNPFAQIISGIGGLLGGFGLGGLL